MHIFLNLAYYRYEAGPRLRDVGFEIVPPLSASNEALAEVPLLPFRLRLGPYPTPTPSPTPNPYT